MEDKKKEQKNHLKIFTESFCSQQSYMHCDICGYVPVIIVVYALPDLRAALDADDDDKTTQRWGDMENAVA